jgi:uncharacterized membrane protein required for colicin V production
MHKQKGVVPIIVLIVLVSAAFGGYLGFQLGGGTFFSFGVGVAVVFLLYPFVKKLYKKYSQTSSSNDQ